MNEAEAEAVVETGATAGGMLRAAREAAGVHIAALAVALKVPVSKLEALEADNYAALPDTVFVRALASSVCRTLKMDAAPVLALLPQTKSPQLATQSAGLNAPVKGSVGKSSPSSSASFGSPSRAVAVIVVLLLIGALAVLLFPDRHGSSPADPVTMAPAPAAPPGDEAPSIAEPGIERGVASDGSAAGTGSAAMAPGAAGGTAVPPAAAPDAPLAAASAPAVAAQGAVTSPAAPAAAPSSTLVLRARSQSWIQVRDAAGKTVLERTLAADESVAVAAPPPLAVVIGRADATEVFVRGRPFDLASVSRENVARFEVK